MDGSARYILAVLCLLVVVRTESKSITDKTTPLQLFFTHNDTLVHVTLLNDGTRKKSILVDEAITDYAIDELRDRLFWVSRNNSVYVKTINSTGKSLPLIANNNDGTINSKIACDVRTNKLYFSNDDMNVIALDLKNGDYHRWHVVLRNEKDFWFNNDTRIRKISLDPEMGIMFVQYDNGTFTDIYRYNMDGTERKHVLRESSSHNFDYDLETKELHQHSDEIAADEDQLYSKYLAANRSYKVIVKGPNIKKLHHHHHHNKKHHKQPLMFLDNFNANDVKNLKVYRKSLKKLTLTDPCSNETNGGCGDEAMCLLRLVWPGKSCARYSAREKKTRIARQIPFDMYSQQPTLRPEPQPTQPDNSFLPVYLSIIG